MIVGFRTENYSGQGYRGVKEVFEFETKELKNEDIYDTLKATKGFKTKKQVKEFINDLNNNCYQCIWLCSSMEQLVNSYFEQISYEHTVTVDQYECDDEIIISDLASDGKLIASKSIRLVNTIVIPNPYAQK